MHGMKHSLNHISPSIETRKIAWHVRALKFTYLLRRHMRIGIHPLEHLLLRLSIRCRGIGSTVHRLLRTVFLVLREGVLTERAVIRRSHVLVWLHTMLRRHLAGGTRRWTRSLARALGMGGRLLAWDDVDQEIEHVRFGESRRNVGPLQGAPLVVLCVDPRAHRQLGDEDIAAFGEENGRLSRDHLHVRIRLHHFLYARQRQLVNLVVVVLIFQVADDMLPICRQDITGLPCETLIHLVLVR